MKVLASISLTLKGINKKLKSTEGKKFTDENFKPKSLWEVLNQYTE